MKKHTKLFALTMALVIAVLSFSACGGADNGEAKAAAEGFMNGFCALDDSVINTYVTEDADLGEIQEIIDAAQSLSTGLNPDQLFGEGIGDKFADEFENFKNGVKSVFSDAVKYEIKNVSVKGEKAEAKITISYPDSEASDIDVSDVDPADFGFSQEGLMAYIYEKYTQEELASMSQDEIMELSVNYMKDNNTVGKMFDYVVNMMKESFEGAEETSEDFAMTLELQDGKWLVSKVE